MVVNRLQSGLINSGIAPWAEITYFFVVILMMKTTMYHKYTLKYQKKCKKTLLSSMFHFALNIGGISAQSHMFIICHLFFQLHTLIWLLHCNAMNFDGFSLGAPGARHLFQN
jgi:hypothetical protein